MKKQLIKTSIKGLYLTIDGKAWHKACKCEIKPTLSNKVRFNGKMYDLQKLINYSRKNDTKVKRINTKQPPPVKKTVSIRELQKQGFKKTQISGLYVSKTGLCYNSISNKSLTITNGKTTINGKAYNVAKIVLKTFLNVPVRNGRIIFINGNNKYFNIENLKYKSTIKVDPPKETLVKCIRLYFEVSKNFKKSSFLFKYYLHQIILKRGFEYKYKGADFDLFLDYSKSDFLTSKNQTSVFKKFNYTTTNGKNAINKYLNLLVSECLQDFENGLLKLKDFAPKPQTKTQKLKQLQKSVNEYGLNIKIPLRKPSVKELLSQYKKKTNEISELLKKPL